MQDIDIRPLRATDLASAIEVIDSTALFPGDMLVGMTEPFLTEAASEALWLVAVRGERLLGLAYCAPEALTDQTWNLLLIAVRSTDQGRGAGSALTRRIEAILSEHSARVLIVETSGLPVFEDTRVIYRTLGYAEVARIPEFYAKGEDKIFLWKTLPV